MNTGKLTGRDRTEVLNDGRMIGEIEDRWSALLKVADVLNPGIRQQLERGILDPLTDFDMVKVRLFIVLSTL